MHIIVVVFGHLVNSSENKVIQQFIELLFHKFSAQNGFGSKRANNCLHAIRKPLN